MTESHPTMAQQIAMAASDFQMQLTGHAPKSVTVIHDNDTLVITLHGTLTLAELALVMNPLGAAKVEEFHRQLFAVSADSLQEQIRRITGVEVKQTSGAMMHVLPDGRTVQVFLLTKTLSPESWNRSNIAD